MPVHEGKDEKGKYSQWESHGAKYRGKDAKKKAAAQGVAARANGYKGE